MSRSIHRQSGLLQQLAASEARLIETWLTAKHGPHGLDAVPSATLAKLAEDLTHRLPKVTFGRSSEFILASRRGDRIILSRRGDPFMPGPTRAAPLHSGLAAPARLGLMGKSGIVTTLDYAGIKVLAAHEPVPGYEFAVVAKTDLSEVRRPFFLAGVLSSGGLIVFLILVTAGWHRISKAMMQRDPATAQLRQSEAHLSGTVRDVSERRLAEERLRQQAKIFDQIHDAVIYTDTRGTVLSWNHGAERQSGYPAGDAVGRNIEFFIAPQDKERFWREMAPVAYRAGSAQFDVWLRHRSGVLFRGHSSAAVVCDPQGNIVGSISCILDVTDKYRTAEALRTSEERLAGILRMAPEAVITIDIEQHITLFSNSASRIFGYKDSEVLGQPLEILIPEADRERHDAQVRAFANGTSDLVDLSRQRNISCRRKDGSLFPALASVSKLRLTNETVFTVLLHDISERMQNEQALIEAKQQAEIANRTKSDFLAHMSHELRTPLNAILGFSQMMMAGMLPRDQIDRVNEYATDIFDSGTHLLEVINDLLDLAKIEAGHTDLEETDVDLGEVIATSLRQVDGRARDAGLRVLNKVRGDMPLLWADERKLKQVVLNLLSNAVKFTPRNGKIIVTAGVHENGRMELSVQDTGNGMTAAEIELSLQPFGQIDNVMTRNHHGTGLGLPLSRSLCQIHGGDLQISSVKSVGTTVSVYLPRERVLSAQRQEIASNGAIAAD
ncbi:MAG: PAS domain S-box protein [Proteobacteria bacterium]|nr:PAS domain S-box protein [Pseudomonadota bacterium]